LGDPEAEAVGLHDQLVKSGVDEKRLAQIESRDNVFPEFNCHF
jgi:hypothetical protein